MDPKTFEEKPEEVIEDKSEELANTGSANPVLPLVAGLMLVTGLALVINVRRRAL